MNWATALKVFLAAAKSRTGERIRRFAAMLSLAELKRRRNEKDNTTDIDGRKSGRVPVYADLVAESACVDVQPTAQG